MSLSTPTATTPLKPSRALVHPLWLSSLAVLALNDHVLKGASILPSAVTGKLSDFAGLIVAPLLLAVLLRARTQRGWLLAHIAVGGVFSAIQLSATAAHLWSAAMETVAFPWVITRDPTDLIALPALLVSATVLRTVAEGRTAGMGRRSVELAAGGVGLLCCTATSRPPEPFERPDIRVEVFVHNAGEEDIVVRMRPLAEGVSLDCDVIAEDPGRLLTEPLFGNTQALRLEPDQNFGLGNNGDPVIDGCLAYLLDVDGMRPTIVMWRDDERHPHLVPGEGYGNDISGGIDLFPSSDPDTFGTIEEMVDDSGLVFPIPPATEPVGGSCAPQGDASRLEWSPIPAGDWHVVDIDRGADGCFAVDLGTTNNEEELVAQDRWYLCAPLDDLGLAPGRQITISMLAGVNNSDGGVDVTTIDADPELPTVTVRAFRGNLFPEFQGLSVSPVPDFDCAYAVASSCGTITRATSVTAGGPSYGTGQVFPGENRQFEGNGGTMTVAVAHAEERAAVDSTCAEGPSSLGLDLEVAAVFTQPAAG